MIESRAARAAFLGWGRQTLVRFPLKELNGCHSACLGEIIGDARIVALGEGAHAAVEPLEFRNRLFRFLVEEKGFTTIAIESGVVEGRVVHDYLRGRGGDLRTVLAQGIGWTFDRLPQNRDLVVWMHDYNLKANGRINFYGFDVPGSPGNAAANRPASVALIELLEYLDRVDPKAATAFHDRIDALIPYIHIDCTRESEGPRYTLLDARARDSLTAAVADLLTLIERKEAQYLEASSSQQYQWAHRAAVGARQVDAWLRHVPPGWQPRGERPNYSDDEIAFFMAAQDTRDRAQADNLQWILEREGAGKVLVYGSRFHVSTSPFKVGLAAHQTAGTYLRRRCGDRLLTIGNLIGGGNSGEGSIARASPDTIDGVAGEFAESAFLLDLREAPELVARWLSQEHRLGAGQEGCRLNIGAAFDVLLYFDVVTTA